MEENTTEDERERWTNKELYELFIEPNICEIL